MCGFRRLVREEFLASIWTSSLTECHIRVRNVTKLNSLWASTVGVHWSDHQIQPCSLPIIPSTARPIARTLRSVFCVPAIIMPTGTAPGRWQGTERAQPSKRVNDCSIVQHTRVEAEIGFVVLNLLPRSSARCRGPSSELSTNGAKRWDRIPDI
jgi:hypothetical protein